MKINKPQHILAVHDAFLAHRYNMVQGVYSVSLEEMSKDSAPFLVTACRELLETDPKYRQILPYLMLIKPSAEGGALFFAYRRCKGIGENRLLGKVSVGLGGHVDFKDVICDDSSVVQLEETCMQAVIREAAEEVRFVTASGTPAQPELKVGSYGAIYDSSDEVGRVHVGILLSGFLPHDINVECQEEELETIGFLTAEELLSGKYDLENWSAMALSYALHEGQKAAQEKSDADNS